MSPFDTLYSGLTMHRMPNVLTADNDNRRSANDNAGVDDMIARGAYRLIQATGWVVGGFSGR